MKTQTDPAAEPPVLALVLAQRIEQLLGELAQSGADDRYEIRVARGIAGSLVDQLWSLLQHESRSAAEGSSSRGLATRPARRGVTCSSRSVAFHSETAGAPRGGRARAFRRGTPVEPFGMASAGIAADAMSMKENHENRTPQLDRRATVAEIVDHPERAAEDALRDLEATSDLARLRAEHGNIARLVLVLESHLATVHTGDGYDARLIHDALAYLIGYVDRFHLEREDLVAAVLAIHRPTLRVSMANLIAQHVTVRASGAELGALLERSIEGALAPRAELVRQGFAYCTALRRSMAIEETILGLATNAPDPGTSARGSRETKPAAALDGVDEERYQALFEALTQRAGCGCSYVRSTCRTRGETL